MFATKKTFYRSFVEIGDYAELVKKIDTTMDDGHGTYNQGRPVVLNPNGKWVTATKNLDFTDYSLPYAHPLLRQIFLKHFLKTYIK
jgi:hypothetical protein